MNEVLFVCSPSQAFRRADRWVDLPGSDDGLLAQCFLPSLSPHILLQLGQQQRCAYGSGAADSAISAVWRRRRQQCDASFRRYACSEWPAR
ncbi:unnamed protein product [Gongylonema pulchrum]|uniref:Protein-tyrosine-phosphatase n=1 Tax=Gongylonema pulchrum TaxID=637853 RepID=A0A183ENA7_9BILA|nr:unnamed protein product [Gongylonema pulchrum]